MGECLKVSAYLQRRFLCDRPSRYLLCRVCIRPRAGYRSSSLGAPSRVRCDDAQARRFCMHVSPSVVGAQGLATSINHCPDLSIGCSAVLVHGWRPCLSRSCLPGDDQKNGRVRPNLLTSLTNCICWEIW